MAGEESSPHGTTRIGALIITIRFWGILYHITIIRYPKKVLEIMKALLLAVHRARATGGAEEGGSPQQKQVLGGERGNFGQHPLIL